MDPYDVLGIPATASLEEIKKAYRREAMKWHPDRCNNSPEARERFHQAAEAFKYLSENYSPDTGDDSTHQSTGESRYQGADSAQSERYSDSQYSSDRSEDKFADTVFWEVMLDFAIKLAQTGLNESAISIQLVENGCQQELATIIADKAFNIHAHYASSSGRKKNQGADKSTFREERLESELQKAFIGGGNIFLSPRDTIDYYLVVFREFRQSRRMNLFTLLNTNRWLMRILNFSILFFAATLLALDFYPWDSEYKLLPDETLLQLPLGVLALMLIWTAYRKLWLLTLCFWLIFLVSLAFFNANASRVLHDDYLSMLPIVAICYAPFIFIALFGNYCYYRKAQIVIQSANRLFTDHQDKIVWIRSNAGTSSVAAIIFGLVLSTSLLYMKPEGAKFLGSIDLRLPGMDTVEDDAASQKIKLRMDEAGLFFEIAESHFNSSPPDYLKASMAYSNAADSGSLLAAYKLGYMHYVGVGVKQNDLAALDYFELATRTSLAFQPHSLQLTTEFLAEAYNNLGIMYQDGYGTQRNTRKAGEMYRMAIEFGSENARQNLRTLPGHSDSNKRRLLVKPVYR